MLLTGLILLALGDRRLVVRQPHVAAGCRCGSLARLMQSLGLFPSLSRVGLQFFIVAALCGDIRGAGLRRQGVRQDHRHGARFHRRRCGGDRLPQPVHRFRLSFWTWIIALVGGLIGAVLFNRFIDWGLIIFASLLGSMLLVNGAMQALLPSLSGTYGSLVIVVLTVLGIFYHARQRK